MEMIAIAVYATKFLKELEESTSGKERVRPERTSSALGRGISGRVSDAIGAIGRRLGRRERCGSSAGACDAGASAA